MLYLWSSYSYYYKYNIFKYIYKDYYCLDKNYIYDFRLKYLFNCHYFNQLTILKNSI